MFALVFVAVWLYVIEPDRCAAPVVDHFIECQAAREARIRWERS